MDGLDQIRRQSTSRRVLTQIRPTVNLPVPDVSNVGASVWENIATQAQKAADNISEANDRALAENAKAETQRRILRATQIENDIELQDIELRNQFRNDPDGYQRAFDEYSATFLSQTEGEFSDLASISLDKQYAKSYAGIKSDQLNTQAGQTKDALELKADKLSENLRLLARAGKSGTEEFKNTYRELNSVLGTAQTMGYTSQELSDQFLDESVVMAKGQHVLHMYEQMVRANDPNAESFIKGFVEDPNTGLSEDERKSVYSTAKVIASEMNAQTSAAVADAVSKYEFDIERTDDPNELNTLEMNILKDVSPVDPIKARTLQSKIFQKMEKVRKESEDITNGSMFASGGAYLNPADENSKKQLDAYYEKILMPQFGKMDMYERNTRVAQLVNNTKVVPQAVIGDIQNAARSLDPQTVTAAADLIGKISTVNPHMLSALPEKDLARIGMVDRYLNAGYTEEEAFKKTEAMLDPSNKAMVEQRQTYLRERVQKKKLDYGAKAMANFQGFFSSVNKDPVVVGNSGPQMIADYRDYYETHYALTGDEALAEKHANDMVKGKYSLTTINGFNQISEFAPEKYYSIPGVDNSWMREQVIEAVKGLGPMMVSADTDLSKDVIVAPFSRTAETAAKGQPEYMLMLRTKTGELIPLIDDKKQAFVFDPDAKRKAMVEEARYKKERAIIEAGGNPNANNNP